jgi:hypothetical protein
MLCCGVRRQVTDGAAAVLMMTRAEATRRGLPILGVFRSFAAVRRMRGGGGEELWSPKRSGSACISTVHISSHMSTCDAIHASLPIPLSYIRWAWTPPSWAWGPPWPSLRRSRPRG